MGRTDKDQFSDIQKNFSSALTDLTDQEIDLIIVI